MNKKVFDFYSIIKEERENIDKFSKTIKASGELSKRINMVICEMDSIRKDMIALEENINKEKARTLNIEDKINNIKENEIKENVDLLVEIIIHNLPKDVQAEFIKNSYEKYNKQVIDLMKLNNIIGEILIYNDEDKELKINVKLWGDEEKNQVFTVKEKYRIFNIISFIHMNLSYN